ncbi:hypothetical protein TRP8649_02811 [Pelagimonas phthalicica]|uniref:Uncharacterized protein n=1 Tax=Pelagimonas phthalicica TaxID=1037362 RepID=A0A238JE36_9RHOB|nr:hypothetical protein [Pelagimonas phthalicica]TDS91637.1 hypothetical protein CLV87_2813 [Pelagimonas phthalicica]SMX28685.1 hypothetical protein TRP8649_02811 [Pelagimonas phthalicica]
MERNMATTATLTFTEDRFVSLSKLSEILTTALLRVKEVVAAVETEQNKLIITCDRYCTVLDVIYGEKHTQLTVCVLDKPKDAETSRETKLAHLAFLLFPLCLNLPATYLTWPLSDVHIPRQRFVDGLADSFKQHKPEPKPQPVASDELPDEEDLRDMIRQASHSLQANPRSKPEHVKTPRSVFDRLSQAARPVLSSLH